MTDKCLPPLPQTKRVFKVTTTSKQWHREICGERNRLWSIPPRTTEKLFTTSHNPHHRIIATHMNGTIMREYALCDRCQPSPRIIIPVSNRLITQIAARHHQYGRATHAEIGET